MRDNKNQYFTFKITVLLITLFSFSYNAISSGMTLFGIIINLIGLFMFFVILLSNRYELFIIFYFASLLFGPFIVFDFSIIGFDALGRLDFLVSFPLFFFLIHQSSFKFKFYSFIFFFSLILQFLLTNFGDVNIFFILNRFFYVIGNSAIGLNITMLIFSKRNKFLSNNILYKIFYIIFLFHILLSISQLFIPISLRDSSSIALLNISGIMIYRPSGLLDNSYAYSLVTLVLFYYLYVIEKNNKGIKFIIIQIALIPILFLLFASSRAIFIGAIIYLLFFIIRKLRFNLSFPLYLSSWILFYFLIYLSPTTFLVFDQSNNTKIILWYLAIEDYISNFNLHTFLFGNGYISSSLVANNMYDFLSSIGLSISYDNRIDLGFGFKIHNVFLQVIYEFGIVFAIVYITPIIYATKRFFNNVGSELLFFLFLAMITNFTFHNGIFSPLIILITWSSIFLNRKQKAL